MQEAKLDKILEEIKNNPSIDWKHIKDIICSVSGILSVLCDSLPSGIFKTILCGISSLLSMMCNKINESDQVLQS